MLVPMVSRTERAKTANKALELVENVMPGPQGPVHVDKLHSAGGMHHAEFRAVAVSHQALVKHVREKADAVLGQCPKIGRDSSGSRLVVQ